MSKEVMGTKQNLTNHMVTSTSAPPRQINSLSDPVDEEERLPLEIEIRHPSPRATVDLADPTWIRPSLVRFEAKGRGGEGRGRDDC